MTLSYGRGSCEELANPGRSGDGGSWAVAKLIAHSTPKAHGKLRFMMVQAPSQESANHFTSRGSGYSSSNSFARRAIPGNRGHLAGRPLRSKPLYPRPNGSRK